MLDKLIMISTTEHKLAFGTILSATKIHRNRRGYMATEAEREKIIPIYVPFKQCKEV